MRRCSTKDPGANRLARRRNRQALEWMNELTILGLEELFQSKPAVAARLPVVREEVRRGRVSPLAASRELLGLFHPETEGRKS